MIYVETISTPANTLAAAEQLTRFNVALGLVVKLEVYFPPGSSGLTHVRICDASFQAFPATPGEDFFGDNITLAYEELYDKSADPALFDIWTYNLDDTYPHIVQVRMVIVSKDEYMARYLPGMSSDMLTQALAAGELQKTAERSRRVKDFVSSLTTEGA